MNAITTITRLPRIPLVALAALALALGAAGGAAPRAEADPTTPYKVAVNWQQVSWSYIDDGVFNSDFEVFGTLTVSNLTTGETQIRMIGDINNPGRCSAAWNGSGPCYKTVTENAAFNLSQTPMSASVASGQGTGSYFANNHVASVTVRPGEVLSLSVNLFDYDATSANDVACEDTFNRGFNEATLKTLNINQTMVDTKSDTHCAVSVIVKRG